MRKFNKIILTSTILALGQILLGTNLGSQLTDLGSARPQGAPAADLSNAYAFPVPFKPSLGQPYISFINLSGEATVRIYDVNGTMVRTLHASKSDSGILKWDVTDDKGNRLSSDVFLYVIESSEQTKSGKLLVVR